MLEFDKRIEMKLKMIQLSLFFFFFADIWCMRESRGDIVSESILLLQDIYY